MDDSTAAEANLETPLSWRRERAGCRAAFGRSLRLAEVAEGGPGRGALEEYVRTGFRRKHSATVNSFMPTLLSFVDASGDLRGVIGLRRASIQPLFLEQYLDLSAEAAIASATHSAVRRQGIVEIGNLAAANCRMAVRMVALLPGFLLAQRYRWIVFTATSAVREILLGFGAPLVELARADAAQVTNGADDWGSYYEADPRVFAGHLPDSRLISGFASVGHDH